MADLVVIFLNAFSYILVLILVALGLMVVFGMMGVINMAHGELFMLGAYTVVAARGLGVPFWGAVVLAPLVVGAIGLLIEGLLIRHIYRRPLDTILATWGLSIALKQAIVLVFGPASYSVSAPMQATLAIGDFSYPVYRLALMAITLAVIAATFRVFMRTDFGLVARAVIARPDTAAGGNAQLDDHRFGVSAVVGIGEGHRLVLLELAELGHQLARIDRRHPGHLLGLGAAGVEHDHDREGGRARGEQEVAAGHHAVAVFGLGRFRRRHGGGGCLGRHGVTLVQLAGKGA